jgi:hypothetical protein
VRVCHDAQTGRPFTLTTEALSAAAPGRADKVKALAAERSVEVSPEQSPPAMPSKEFHRRHRYQPQQSVDRPFRSVYRSVLRSALQLERNTHSRKKTCKSGQITLDCYHHHVLTTWQLQRCTSRACELLVLGCTCCTCSESSIASGRLGSAARARHRGTGSSTRPARTSAEQLGVERKELNWRRASALAIAASAKLRHHIEVNEFFSRLASEAAAQGGALTEWYGERTTQRLFHGRITPDGYGVLNLAGRAPLHILLELDRATERLHGKATRYAQELPRSVLCGAFPVIIMTVPTSARARAANAAIASTAAPITVAVWESTARH